jgi:putative membrane protein
MDLYLLFKYLHFVTIFGVVSAVVAQHLLLKNQMTRGEITRVVRIDAVYGISAILVLLIGLVLWFGVGKPAAFYSSNWIFHLKLTTFLVVGLISIIPTRYFLKNRKGDPQERIQLPKRIKMIIRLELALLFIIPLLAVLMAQGTR